MNKNQTSQNMKKKKLLMTFLLETQNIVLLSISFKNVTYITTKIAQTYLSEFILVIYIMQKETTSQENTHDDNFISYSHLRNLYTECKLVSSLFQPAAPGYLA